MKIVKCLSVALFAMMLFSSCKKEGDEVNPEYVKRADEFKAFIQAKRFQIKNYYSDRNIDYIEDDQEVRQETELWRYVSPWLKDDFNVFDNASGKVSITQNEVKIPENDAEVIVKDFKIGVDKDGPYFDFLTHEYQPLKYRLVEFTDNYFVVYVNWHSGAKVFTRFEVVQ